jgi:hypothetical protein
VEDRQEKVVCGAAAQLEVDLSRADQSDLRLVGSGETDLQRGESEGVRSNRDLAHQLADLRLDSATRLEKYH